MSERTISPGMDQTNSLPQKNRLDICLTSQPTGHSESVKRKWSPDHSNSSTATVTSQHEVLRVTENLSPDHGHSQKGPKRAKVEEALPAQHPSADAVQVTTSDKSHLPAEMWQYVFTCLPPYTLGRLMCVNKIFHSLLATDAKLPAPELSARGSLRLIHQEHLWSLSRRAFFPGMPRPLTPRTERETWKLVRGDGCEFCGKTNRNTLPPVSTSPWAAGPGNDYVRIIWPFAVRSCGTCLRARLQKETELLFSSSSALLPSLSFAFFTPSLNYVASITLRREPPPTGLQLTKWYFGPQVEEMKAKLDEVIELGPAAAEEWFKGLEVDGKEKAADAARWEHWEFAGGFQAIAHSMVQSRTFQRPNQELHHDSSTTSVQQTYSNVGMATIHDSSGGRPAISAQVPLWTVQAPPSTLPPKPATPVSPFGLGYPGFVPNYPMSAPKLHTRVERSIHDVNEKKNARRAEIERRCAELDPPIKPSTLVLIDSFSAALQIAMPLTDQAWERLKPRLLAQRETAEQQEREQLVQNQFLLQQTEERKQQEAQLKEAKETIDREWDESQRSVREKLESYADNFIREQWQNGDTITKGTCAQFAADVLLHVRHRFYTFIAQEDAHMRAMGIPVPVDSPHTAPTRKLTLENMRWLYENKIRPLTEHIQKELFLCSACDNHGRYYSLDSVVQHFAAKHTDSLSMGTAVVYWKADWPELPPFDPNPTAAKISMYASTNPSPAFPPGQFMYSAPPAYHGHASGTHTSPDQLMHPIPHNGQNAYQRPSQGYGNASPAYQEPPSPRNPFQRMDQTATRSYNHPVTSTCAAAPGYGPRQLPDYRDWRRQKGPNNSISLSHQHFPQTHPAQQTNFGARPASALAHVSQNAPHPIMPPNPHQFSRPQPSAGARSLPKLVPPGQPMGIYQIQIQDLAHNAREIWDGTSDILDMPDGVRVQVILRHVVLRFKEKYTNEPNLALFTDGLNNNSQMSPIRALSGLSCKACATESRMSLTYGSNDTQDLEQRMHTLPALLAHFQSAHVEHVQPIAISPNGIEMPRLDWKFDMIEMPDASVVRNLIYSPGITQAKLNLIATVLPSYFPSPLPQVDAMPYRDNDGALTVEPEYRNTPQDCRSDKQDDSAAQSPFEGSTAAGQIRHLSMAGSGSDIQRSAYHLRDEPTQDLSRVEVPREDEYDPHRPAYVNVSEPEMHRAIFSDPPAYARLQQHEDISAYRVEADPHARHNAEAVIKNTRAAATPEYAVPPSYGPDSGQLDVEAPGYSNRKISGPGPQTRWTGQDSRPAHIERRTSPPREPLNAAEQFLRSFDLISDTIPEPSRSTPAVGTFTRNEYSQEAGGDPDFRPRMVDHDWPSNHPNARTVEYSGKSSPSDAGHGQYEMPDGAIAEPHQAREYDRLYGRRLLDPIPRTQRSPLTSPEHQTLPKARAGHLPSHLRTVRDSPSRRPNSRFDRYQAQRQGSQLAGPRSPAPAAEPLPTDDAYSRDFNTIHRPAGRQVYAADAEERYRSYPHAEEIMYRRAPQASQVQYIEKPSYLGPVHDRYVEYVRVTPRDSEPAGEYYVQRPAPHSGIDAYVGYEPTRSHEHVFEQAGHLYTQASPSSEEYRDPYAR